MIVSINYANNKYKTVQRINSSTAIMKGKVDKVISYSPKDIDPDFAKRNKDILNCKRGNGYWLWKPYIILKTLECIKFGDYLVYLDSGAFYINSVKYLINQMEADNQDIMAFELPFKERLYTKRDAFVYMECDDEKYSETNQRMATMIIFRNNARTLQFVCEWLQYAQAEKIITDSTNHLGKNNYKGFRDHRHDQSIFSLLSKKYNIKAYREPSQYGRYPELMWGTSIKNIGYVNMFAQSDYPQIIAEHKCSYVSKFVYWEQMLYAYAPENVIKFYLKYLKEHFVRHRRAEKIALLTDNMPIRESEYGYGMYKVVNRLLLSLGNNIDTIICTDRMYDEKKEEIALLRKQLVVNNFHNIKNEFVSNLSFLFQIMPIIVSLKKKNISKIFIPLGADYHELQRAYLVSKFFHMNVSIYVVDDFLEYEEKINKTDYVYRLGNVIIRYLKGVKHIFVISEGMQERIMELTGKRSTLLPIPYQYENIKYGDNNKMQIMFLGSINALYIKALKDIAEIIDEINKELNIGISLVFTYKNLSDIKHTIGSYSCINTKRIDKEEDLRCEMHSSLFCFMPYSDDEYYSHMQNTSFPSKLVEYLSSARSIVIYGNKENSAQKYFDNNNLSYVIYGRNKEALKQTILNHIQKNIDYSNEYVKVLRKYHSYKHIQKIIMDKV